MYVIELTEEQRSVLLGLLRAEQDNVGNDDEQYFQELEELEDLVR